MPVTDYSTACGASPLSFIQMLASCIYGYHDIAGVIHYRINGLVETNACTELSDFLECDTSHIDPERQLVENTFALDLCSLLAWKVFHNQDVHWEDYSKCGEVPKTFIEMLARTIVNYNSHSRINAIVDSDDCTGLESLLTCSTNAIESERLLVTNAFGVDDCDRFLVKFFANTSTMTDYHTECTGEPQTFYQLLARCLVIYDGYVYINTAAVLGDCTDLHAFWTCANNHIDPERALCENIFATDDCGNLALKIFANGEIRWEGGDQ
jgi:hypothetical protein